MSQQPSAEPRGARAEQPSADEAGIARLHAEFMAAVTRADAEALRDLVTEDYEVWASAAPSLAGRDTVVTAMRAAMQRYHIEQSFHRVELIIAGDWAIERGTEHIRATVHGTSATELRSQRAMLILRRGSDGRWRYARGMTNALPAPPSPPG